MAAAPGWTKNAEAVASFALWLAELIELAGADRIAVAIEDGALVVTNEAGESALPSTLIRSSPSAVA